MQLIEHSPKEFLVKIEQFNTICEHNVSHLVILVFTHIWVNVCIRNNICREKRVTYRRY
jgi:hypothetical protein